MSIDSMNTAGIECVELKVTMGAEQVDAGLAGFALEAESAERRSIWFCERIDAYRGPAMLPLLDRGTILRVRKIKDSPDDSTLKLRGLAGGVDPGLWRQRTRKWKKGAGKLGAEVVAELWEIDSGPRFLELSMRVNVNQDPRGTQLQLEHTVRDHGLDIAAGQQTKTATVLRYLATAAGRRARDGSW